MTDWAKIVRDGIARTKASLEAYDNGSRKYWYFISEDYCPVCGHVKIARERMYTPRPEAWEDRHECVEFYDYCDVL